MYPSHLLMMKYDKKIKFPESKGLENAEYSFWGMEAYPNVDY